MSMVGAAVVMPGGRHHMQQQQPSNVSALLSFRALQRCTLGSRYCCNDVTLKLQH